MKKKKIKASKRGLTFSISKERIGCKFRYIIDKKHSEIRICFDEKGENTVSRKKCGNNYKALFDLRSKQVKEMVADADYLEIEQKGNEIIVHVYKEMATGCSKKQIDKIGEIILPKDCLNTVSIPKWLKNIFGFGKKLQTTYKVASLFSGAGLLDHAFLDDEFKIVYANDIDANACETYKYNIGPEIECKSIENVKEEDIPPVDIILAGLPCQSYSNANRTNQNSASGEQKRLLIDHFIRIVKAKLPKIFVIENVPQILTRDNGRWIDKLRELLPFNYNITNQIVSDDEVGGYTQRKRAFVIGTRKGILHLPKLNQGFKTVGEALSKVDPTWFNWNDVTIPKESTRLCMSYVPQGGNWKDIPKSVRTFGKDTHSSIYKRLDWNSVSPTLTNWRKSNITHPFEDRILNVSEAVALSGFGKKFHVLGKTLDSKQQQIGNGVTSFLGKNLMTNILGYLRRMRKS